MSYRLQNCVFKYARAVKQKVWNEAQNRERDWGETLRARKTLTPRFIDFFTDFEKKNLLFCGLHVILNIGSLFYLICSSS